jgi:nitrogen-specific signal transduction histidine kinase
MTLSYIQPISLEFSEVDLNEILQAAVSGVEEKIDSRGIKVDLDLDHELPYIHADRSHLCNALETILRNACLHFTIVCGEVVLRLSYPAFHLAEDDMEHFFYPFVAEELGEADLEVALTKVVIHRHGGTIDIERDAEDKILITIIFTPIGKTGERIA